MHRGLLGTKKLYKHKVYFYNTGEPRRTLTSDAEEYKDAPSPPSEPPPHKWFGRNSMDSMEAPLLEDTRNRY